MDSFQFQPIGFFHSTLEHPNEAPRQPNPLLTNTAGHIQLKEGFQLQDGLRDLSGFSHIWVLFHFHKNDQWNPLVMPPRGSDIKRGVFATRSPYRPNPIGMSVLELVSIQGLKLNVGPSDLLNGTPVVDIKPYIPYVDCHPHARTGWLESSANEKYSFSWSDRAKKQVVYLEKQGLTQLRGFVVNQLEYEPGDARKKRLYIQDQKLFLAYRTWRVEIDIDEKSKHVTVVALSSGYSEKELSDIENDLYHDKALHRSFNSSEF